MEKDAVEVVGISTVFIIRTKSCCLWSSFTPFSYSFIPIYSQFIELNTLTMGVCLSYIFFWRKPEQTNTTRTKQHMDIISTLLTTLIPLATENKSASSYHLVSLLPTCLGQLHSSYSGSCSVNRIINWEKESFPTDSPELIIPSTELLRVNTMGNIKCWCRTSTKPSPLLQNKCPVVAGNKFKN